MWNFDPDRVRANIRQASTEDLLDRLTILHGSMEPEALRMIEEELHARGVTAEQIEAHAAARQSAVLTRPDGTPEKCSFCHRPAVEAAWGWQKLWRLLPVFPRLFYYCEEHRPTKEAPT